MSAVTGDSSGDDVPALHFREYDPVDTESVLALNEWALRDVGIDPADVPGHEDLQRVEKTYLESGGGFVVGVAQDGVDGTWRERLETRDGYLVAMGGFLPNEAGHDDERTVTGAAELHRMRVAPPLQGRGYGTALLSELERRIVQAGFDVVLATTATRQHRATEFYPTRGYRAVDTSEYGEYELVHFEKTLDESTDGC